MIEAWRTYDELLADYRVVFAEEPDDVEVVWRSLTPSQMVSTNVWSDAYLAAFAQAADFEVVTFDKGFAQYTALRHTILS